MAAADTGGPAVVAVEMSLLATSKRRLSRHLTEDQRDLLRGVRRRPRGQLFWSPAAALRRSSLPAATARLEAVRSRVAAEDELAVHQNVTCYPLSATSVPDRLGDYFQGGLAYRRGDLIPQAVHYNGVAFSQSLPTSYVERLRSAGRVEVRQPVLFGGILFNHFGHFLAESLGRLYAYQRLADLDPFILFHAPTGRPRYLERDNFIHQVLTGFGIPLKRVIFDDRILELRQAVVPRQQYGFGFLHRPDTSFCDFLRSFRIARAWPKGLSGGGRIYVSRSDLRRRGSQIGEELFSGFLEEQGYQVFYPERHTLAEQLTVYAHADKLIFSEGSAMLSCTLLPDLQADVAVVCRRRDSRREIRVGTDCLQGFGKQLLWIDAVQAQFQFGLETYDAMAQIDWSEVGEHLRSHRFVEDAFTPLPPAEQAALVKQALRDYLQEIAGDQRFVEHMMLRQEAHPRWTGPSHIVDPRTGQPVWPGIARDDASACKSA